jgi:cyclophilin family peptidyl-prolyl cis-trans isomerase
VAPATFLDSGYTLFGVVVEGQSVADAISKMPTSGPPNDRILAPPKLTKVTIVRVK